MRGDLNDYNTANMEGDSLNPNNLGDNEIGDIQVKNEEVDIKFDNEW